MRRGGGVILAGVSKKEEKSRKCEQVRRQQTSEKFRFVLDRNAHTDPIASVFFPADSCSKARFRTPV